MAYIEGVVGVLLQENLADINKRLKGAALTAHTPLESITLVAVSKSVSKAAIEQAWNLGVRHFGENRLQEAVAKIPALPSEIYWHFVGHLQTNKVRQVIDHFQLIQSLDRMKLAYVLQKEGEKRGRVINALLQVNIGNEKSKSGFHPADVNRALEEIAGLSNLKVRGLMTIAPYFQDPEEVRPYFRAMKDLYLNTRIPNVQMEYLSMGMTHDFEIAVEEGANMIRLGTALFGERDY